MKTVYALTAQHYADLARQYIAVGRSIREERQASGDNRDNGEAHCLETAASYRRRAQHFARPLPFGRTVELADDTGEIYAWASIRDAHMNRGSYNAMIWAWGEHGDIVGPQRLVEIPFANVRLS